MQCWNNKAKLLDWHNHHLDQLIPKHRWKIQAGIYDGMVKVDKGRLLATDLYTFKLLAGQPVSHTRGSI